MILYHSILSVYNVLSIMQIYKDDQNSFHMNSLQKCAIFRRAMWLSISFIQRIKTNINY